MKKHALYFFLLLSPFATAQLKINEIMSNNVSAVMDDKYNYSMWVELYNPSTNTSYNQGSYYFTDDLGQPKKWRPFSKTLAAGAYSVLWFEREDRIGHANFKLEPEGGKLYLLNTLGGLVDSVVYPAQKRNISYGRKTDGSPEWVYFEESSPGASNNSKAYSWTRCENPVFALPAGFYKSTQNISFATPVAGDTIYYTRNGAEPTRKSARYTPGTSIAISATTYFRAKTFSAGKLSSNVVTATYFVGERDIKLPVYSIVTDNANLNDNTIGIYVAGTNGITGNGSNTPVNFNQDWDRPANFELFDTAKASCLNQEVDVTIAGGWSRLNGQKSLRVSPRKKFGDNKLQYDIFKASKPGHKYKSILLRNSGNDFYFSMMRDAFMQSIVMNRLDLDCQAYEPAVVYMNGVYYGIQNLRETSGKDLIYSNYGLDDDDITLLESAEIEADTSFLPLSNYISNNDITQPAVYGKVCQLMDVDNFINYMIAEIYYGNTDWPDNNVKVWKRKQGGKWRWIMYDTDFGYNLYDTGLYNHSTLSMALGEKSDDVPAAWSTLLLRRLVLNNTFKNKFIDRFSVQISTTFDPLRVHPIMDSLANKISSEIASHKAKWGSYRGFTDDLANMRNFTNNRPAVMLSHLGSRFLNAAAVRDIQLSSNIAGASFKFNNEQVIGQAPTLKSFDNRAIAVEAGNIPGYKFKQWEQTTSLPAVTVVAMGSDWKYSDGNSIPSADWYTTGYSDAT
ncbi:MAG TPA: CotH kinase family protein, partial [Paludibacter sp.]|nr:CotH kinase family protein [Paludibacter sp.]